VLENPEKRISGIEIILAEEKNQVLFDFNDTSTPYPKEKTIHELFENQVEKTPDNIAVVGSYEGTRGLAPLYITYKHLNQQTNQLAYLLIGKGVQPDAIAAIVLERSIEMIVGVLAILKAGGAYLPISPDYPKERINYILKDSNACLLLTHKDIETSPSTLTSTSTCQVSPTNLAYVIYTSGTTGKPKGVMIQHQSLVNLCSWHNRYFQVKESDHATQYAKISFDASVWEIFPYLIKGASLTIINPEIKLDIEKLNDFFETRDITISFLPTQLCEQFMELENYSLQKLLTGGDRLGKFIKRNYQLYNNYGPTEDTVVNTSFLVKQYHINIPIGQPIDNNLIYILDKNGLFLQPIGIPGELCIAGDGLARGYLNNPELTAEKFIRAVVSHSSLVIGSPLKTNKGSQKFLPNDQCPMTNDRFYRTGDLARWLKDGNIQFLGRQDHQVKIRGFRIELGEIESQLLKHPGIKETVVLYKTDKSGDKYLCAYIVSSTQGLELELKSYLSHLMPDYMIPSYFVQIEKMPLNPNGKIDHRALPEPETGKTGKEYIAPRNEIEKKLVRIWAEVLGRDTLHTSQLRESISIDDDFFNLGGHSLKATILAAKLYRAFYVKVPLGVIFTTPTIKGLAAYIDSALESPFVCIEPVEKKEYYALSAAQQIIYVTQQMAIESTAYNMPGTFYLKKEPEKDRLENTFRELIERHESLRTSFQIIDRHLVQQVHDMIEFEVEYQHDLTIYHSFVRPFDLSKAPLLRLGLITTQTGSILLVDMHHIISDGISHQVLREEFHAIYDGKELPWLKLQYKDYSQWQNCDEQKERLKQQESYWLKKFSSGIPSLNLSTDYPRPTIQSFEGSIAGFEIEAQETRQLKEIAAGAGATLFMVLLAIYNIFLAKITNQEDIIVGTVVNGRSHPDLERIIGMFVNTLALLNHPRGEMTFKEFIKEIKRKTIQDFENQDYPFDELVEKLLKTKKENRNPIFDVRFTFNNIEPSTGVPPEVIPGPIAKIHNTSKFDLTLAGIEAGEKLHFSFEYCTKLFKEDTIKQFSHYFREILSTAAKNINIKLQDIKLSHDFIDIKSNIDQIDLDF
jgi:amino acid adenylation domain-containing protein